MSIQREISVEYDCYIDPTIYMSIPLPTSLAVYLSRSVGKQDNGDNVFAAGRLEPLFGTLCLPIRRYPTPLPGVILV